MKKTFAVISAITMIFSNSFFVSASESVASYDLNNPEYIEYLSKHEDFEYTKNFFDNFYNILSEEYSGGGYKKLVNIYRYKDSTSFLFELEYSNGVREFIDSSWVAGIHFNDEGTAIKQEELDELVKENNLEHMNATVGESGNVTYEKSSFEDMVKLYHLVLDNFDNYTVDLMYWLEDLPRFSDVIGDANIDGMLSVRDASEIAKKLAVSSTVDLPTNADYNKDGNLNIRDAAAIAFDLAQNT